MKKFFGCTLIAASLFLNGCGDDKEATIEYISIPAGSFVSSVSDTTVTIEAFQLAKTPITVAQFEACVDDDACSIDNYIPHLLSECNYGRGDKWRDHPMNCINWNGAEEFCKWAGGYLPTADEWEYAATHDGTQARQKAYPWGDDEPRHCFHANYFLDGGLEVSLHYCDGLIAVSDSVGTSAVGTYSPQGDSPLGLQDMIGNVYEWTSTSKSNSRYINKGGDDSVVFRNPFTEADQKSSLGGFRCATPVE